MTFPDYNIRNLVSSATTKAEVSGIVEFEDVTNGLIATLRIGAVDGHKTGLLSRPDAISGGLYRTANLSSQSPTRMRKKTTSMRDAAHTRHMQLTKSLSNGNMHVQVSACEGNWLSHLDWDGDRHWTLAETHVHDWKEMGDDALPSDCSKREDLSALLNGDMELSQEHKDRMEMTQRRDAKLRPVPT